MARQIYEVYAKVVDSNGNYNTLTNYPKVFDSRNYQDDIQKTLKRARAEFHETLGAMYKRDDRILQTVILMAADGSRILDECIGTLYEEPEEPSDGGEN